jgi:hypothetical protein
VSLLDTHINEKSIIDELIGKIVYSYKIDPQGNAVDGKWKRTSNGLLTPKPGLGGIAQILA